MGNLVLDRGIEKSLSTFVDVCQSRYRSSIGPSILENAGLTEINNVIGGTAEWINAGLEIVSTSQIA
ncbi:MAG: rhodanese-like domain-containing protein [Pyrinomonadaceae bacterium]